MILDVLVVFSPIWLAFVASTVTQLEIVSPPMPLLPGSHFFDNYSCALFSGVNVPVATMLFNSLIMALGIAIGKIAISLISAFAIVYFRFPGRTTSTSPLPNRSAPTPCCTADGRTHNGFSPPALPGCTMCWPRIISCI